MFVAVIGQALSGSTGISYSLQLGKVSRAAIRGVSVQLTYNGPTGTLVVDGVPEIMGELGLPGPSSGFPPSVGLGVLAIRGVVAAPGVFPSAQGDQRTFAGSAELPIPPFTSQVNLTFNLPDTWKLFTSAPGYLLVEVSP